jgi:hypothetical protein
MRNLTLVVRNAKNVMRNLTLDVLNAKNVMRNVTLDVLNVTWHEKWKGAVSKVNYTSRGAK